LIAKSIDFRNSVARLVAIEREISEVEQRMVEIPAVDRVLVLVLADIGR
jgi:hypothetical protein